MTFETLTVRPKIQDIVKAALAEGAARADVGREAAKETCGKCGKTACSCGTKTAEYALKLAAAVEQIADVLAKEGGDVGPGSGPGALDVSATDRTDTIPHDKGKSHAQPRASGTQKGLPTEQGATQMRNDRDDPPAKGQTQKTAAVVAFLSKIATARRNAPTGSETSGLAAFLQKIALAKKAGAAGSAPEGTTLRALLQRSKTAEDAINPARISAGRAEPPETHAAGEDGKGAPPGDGAVSSNQGARGLTKRDAKAQPKRDLKAYLEEPALSASTDKALDLLFDHSREAGTKVASPSVVDQAMKTAAARVLLRTLAERGDAS